jgi:signal transduction histidine kinase
MSVMAISRSLIWHEIDQQSNRVLTAIGVVTSGVLVVGCLLSILVTSRVSKELMLRTELIRQLAATKRAEKASNYKSQFLAAMSHDVRTPLSCIIGEFAVLSSKPFLPYFCLKMKVKEPSSLRPVCFELVEFVQIVFLYYLEVLRFTSELAPGSSN